MFLSRFPLWKRRSPQRTKNASPSSSATKEQSAHITPVTRCSLQTVVSDAQGDMIYQSDWVHQCDLQRKPCQWASSNP